MKCNIDARGKRTRLIAGMITSVVGMVALIVLDFEPLGAIIGFSCFAGGGFMMFEGWAGWCAVRALGFKTPV